jgi:hypothetical protein
LEKLGTLTVDDNGFDNENRVPSSRLCFISGLWPLDCRKFM